MKRSLARAVLAVVVLLGAADAGATPRYSMQVGQKCNLCHHNPSGGGMRTLYASQYLLPTRIAMQLEESPAVPDPALSESVTIGADLRTFYFQEDRDRLDNFVQMQAAVYLAFQPHERFSGYIHQEFGQNRNNVQAYEVYGLANVLPANGYVKAGKFVPAFGWKQPDHRSFNRRAFVVLPDFPPHSDTGLEAGIYPGSFVLQASVTNGNYAGGFDPDSKVAFTGRGVWRWTGGSFNLSVGGSYYHNHRVNAEKRDAYGPLGGASWKRLTWIGEVDWARVEDLAGTKGTVTSMTSMHELSFRLVQGFDAVGTYDFHDPDVDLATGAVQRIGGGVDVLPYPFLALRARVNAFLVDEGPAVTVPAGFPPDLTTDVTQFTGEIQLLF